MKILSFNLSVVLFMFFSVSLVRADNQLVVMKPEKIFTPKSFDSNDNAQVVVAGVFTGYCMKMGTTEKRVDQNLKKIFIDQSVSITKDCKDLEMYIPYSTVINLGALPAGDYTVYALNADGQYTKMANLPIQQATGTASGTDEHLYAPISSLEFKMTNKASNPKIMIKGVFTNSCLTLESVKVFAREGDVYEILPMVEKNNASCNVAIKTFTRTIILKNFSERDTLIHVRSMNGQSMNKVITNLDRLSK